MFILLITICICLPSLTVSVIDARWRHGHHLPYRKAVAVTFVSTSPLPSPRHNRLVEVFVNKSSTTRVSVPFSHRTSAIVAYLPPFTESFISSRRTEMSLYKINTGRYLHVMRAIVRSVSDQARGRCRSYRLAAAPLAQTYRFCPGVGCFYFLGYFPLRIMTVEGYRNHSQVLLYKEWLNS